MAVTIPIVPFNNDLVVIFEKIKSYVFVSLHFKNKYTKSRVPEQT